MCNSTLRIFFVVIFSHFYNSAGSSELFLWNPTEHQNPEVWTSTDERLQTSTDAFFVFLICSGWSVWVCLVPESHPPPCLCLCVYVKRARFQSSFLQRLIRFFSERRRLLLAWYSEENNLYSSCNVPPKSHLSDTHPFMALQVRDSATQSRCH